MPRYQSDAVTMMLLGPWVRLMYQSPCVVLPRRFRLADHFLNIISLVLARSVSRLFR